MATITPTDPATTAAAAAENAQVQANASNTIAAARADAGLPPVSATPAATTTATGGTNIAQYNANQVTNPTLPNGTEFTPVTQQVQQNELLTGQGATVDANGNQITGANPVAAQLATASTVDPNNALGYIDPQTGQYVAATGNNAPQGTAAQGQVNPLATVKGQLDKLYAETADNAIPTWAQDAARVAQEQLAARGMGASSIGASAITAAVQSSALNIAAPDAATYFQMDMANLSNQQQMALENLKIRQQGLLSDQAALNAASQFNASSKQQTEQFMANLVASIQTQNADRSQAISIFNSQQSLQAGEFNATQENAVKEFNASLKHQRETFNAQMQFAIEQSNTLWRRSVNTANTAAVNAANQANVQNAFNLSATAMNNLWQQFRDEASWMFSASENEKNRQFNAAMAANNRDYADSQQSSIWATAAGAFASSLLF